MFHVERRRMRSLGDESLAFSKIALNVCAMASRSYD